MVLRAVFRHISVERHSLAFDYLKILIITK